MIRRWRTFFAEYRVRGNGTQSFGGRIEVESPWNAETGTEWIHVAPKAARAAPKAKL